MTTEIRRAFKVMTYDIKVLYMAFLGTLGAILLGSLKTPKNFISKKLSNSKQTTRSIQKSYLSKEINCINIY